MTDFEQRYVTARKAVIARDLARLNPMQRQGAMTTEGPLLLLAGAGSGKTTVLIQRVYNLLTYGRGSDSDEVPDWATEEDLDFLEHFPDRPDGDEVRRVHRLCAVDAPRPWEIIAITFTNKAAGELKERLAARLGPAANDVWASTFHSACVRILRRDIDRIGFEKDFTIYDTDDAKRVIKDILKEQNLDEKAFPIRSVLSAISASKDRYEGPEVFRKKAEAANDWKNTRIAKIYAAYQQKLSTANALDFDDIIYHTVTLLQKEPEVLDYYQKKFRYVLVDEYQDTNHLQYLLTGLLAGGHRNLCVVGDDDQSIYRFRGANIENILNFEKQYKDARVIRLEQNYRSTQNILDGANAVIANNKNRKGKRLWTDAGAGSKIILNTAQNEAEESSFIVEEILKNVKGGRKMSDHAVLYRMNAQSRNIEIALTKSGIPHKVIGGNRFFDRKEIKDMTAYFALISNPKLILIGAAAQFGIFGAYMIALALGFEPNQAAGIAIIGGADGPTAIFLSSKLSPNLMGAIAVCAYSYMALVPVIQPPLMRLLTTKKERVIKMKPARQVSQTEKILFPIIGLLLTTFIVPSGLPLLGMLFFGNLLKESGKTTRLAKTASSSLNDIVVILLGLTVGCSTQASEFLTLNTIKIFALGALAFIIASASGILFVKLMNLFLPKGKKLNPLIGNAGVSAVPMSARISNNLGLEYDRHNFLLMHAMGPNVAGVIGSAVAAGALLGFFN